MGPLPVMWGPDGEPVWERGMRQAQEKTSAGSHHASGDPLIGVEVMLASGAIYALGDLFRLSGEEVFQAAARRIAAPLVDELLDPYVDPGAAAISYYRRTFGDDSLDEGIRKKIDRLPPEQQGELAMVFPQVQRRTLPGVGKRADMVHWGVWNDAGGSVRPVREPATATLTLAYQMTGDADYAGRALKQAAARLTMARRVLRGGREHADMGGGICSVAAGHGRNWGWGAVTGCYGPLVLGTQEVQSAVCPAVEVRQKDEKPGLPESVLALTVPPGPGAGEVRFFNGGDGEAGFSWRPEGGKWEEAVLASGETVQKELRENR